jgi:hypothetical protein
MEPLKTIARLFRMDDEAWCRHANPWSVYTRFAAIPLMILAIWSRVWIGWWSLVPVSLLVVWLLVNPHIFPPVTAAQDWAAKGIHGERLWLHSSAAALPGHYRGVLRWLIVPGAAGGLLLAWGVIQLSAWPTVFGATMLTLAQLWRIDRLGLLYDEMSAQNLIPAEGDGPLSTHGRPVADRHPSGIDCQDLSTPPPNRRIG